MSEKNINVTERSKERENEVPDEALSLPTKVHNANWRDDIEDEAEDEIKEVTSYMTFENEQDYQSKEIVNQERAEKVNNLIKAFKAVKGRAEIGEGLSRKKIIWGVR